MFIYKHSFDHNMGYEDEDKKVLIVNDCPNCNFYKFNNKSRSLFHINLSLCLMIKKFQYQIKKKISTNYYVLVP